MMVADWNSLRLHDICSTVTSGARDWAQHYSENGRKFIRMTNLQRDSIQLKLDDLKYVNIQNDSSDGKRTSLRSGDILMSITAELGKIGWVHDGLGEAYINQHTALIRVKSNSADSKFIAYLLSSKALNHRINRLNDSGAKAGLNLPTIRSIPLNLPPLPEQKKIAQILSTWDKAITTTEQLLANSQQQKKALMQQLLTGKKRLLDKNGVRFVGQWKDTPLGEIVEITTGTSKSKFVSNTGHNFIIDMGSVSREGKLIPSKRTNLESDFLEVGQLVMPKDDIGGGNIIGRVGLIMEANRYVLADHVYALKVTENDSLFISYLINSHRVNKSLRRKANGTAQLGLGKKDVLKQVVNIPSTLEEQHKIANVLSTADQEITSLQKGLEALKQEKKALMQQLLTGRRRVKI